MEGYALEVFDVLSGVAIGALSGVLTGFAASVAVLTARRARNARLIARGEPPYRDALLPRFHVAGATAGAVLGGVARLAAPGLGPPVIAGSCVPALLTIVAIAAVIAQLRRR